ncbi:MAG: (2Fe-2S)-binding protein [Hyphomicrobiaceae bacterium]
MSAIKTIGLQVNGKSAEVTCNENTPLLYILRNDLGLKGARFGCGDGLCGACTVLIDGQPVKSCDVPVWSAKEGTIETIEIIRDTALGRQLVEAFIEKQAGQCGYCLTGILVAAITLLEANPQPARQEIADALDGHLCRCGAHNRILDAVKAASDASIGAKL